MKLKKAQLSKFQEKSNKDLNVIKKTIQDLIEQFVKL